MKSGLENDVELRPNLNFESHMIGPLKEPPIHLKLWGRVLGRPPAYKALVSSKMWSASEKTAKRTSKIFWSAQSGFRKRAIMSNGPHTSQTGVMGPESTYALLISGEVGRSWQYCNAKPTREKAGVSY